MLSEPIYDVSEADELMGAIVAKFPTSDQSVGEASRFLYGSPEGGILIPIGNILDLEEAKKLVPPDPKRRPAAPPRNQPKAPYRAPSAGMQYTVLGVIQEYAPREHRTNANPRSRYTMRCPVCTIYVEEETDAFSVSEDNDLWRCFACDERGNARKLLRLLGGIPEPDFYPQCAPRDHQNPFDQGEWNEEEDRDEPEDCSQREIGTWFIPYNQVKFRSWNQSVRDYMNGKKGEFVQSLPTATEAQDRRVRQIELCWDNYKKLRCKNTGEIYLQRYRCGEATCPICTMWLTEKFFTGQGDDGHCKLDVIRESLDNPSIYLVHVASWRYPPDRRLAEQRIKQFEKFVVAMDKRMSDNLKNKFDLAGNHIRGIRVKMEGDVLHYQLVLAGNHQPGAVEMLERFFRQETGVESRVLAGDTVGHRAAGVHGFRPQRSLAP